MADVVVGSVAGLWRYPVKSMEGEGLDGVPRRETRTDETIGLGAPPATFFDFAAIHLVTTATLGALSRAYPNARFDWRRFRPNIIAESDAEGFPENDWVGRRISIGDE